MPRGKESASRIATSTDAVVVAPALAIGRCATSATRGKLAAGEFVIQVSDAKPASRSAATRERQAR